MKTVLAIMLDNSAKREGIGGHANSRWRTHGGSGEEGKTQGRGGKRSRFVHGCKGRPYPRDDRVVETERGEAWLSEVFNGSNGATGLG